CWTRYRLYRQSCGLAWIGRSGFCPLGASREPARNRPPASDTGVERTLESYGPSRRQSRRTGNAVTRWSRLVNRTSTISLYVGRMRRTSIARHDARSGMRRSPATAWSARAGRTAVLAAAVLAGIVCYTVASSLSQLASLLGGVGTLSK